MAEKEQLNRLAHEALGKCWHDIQRNGYMTNCGRCGQQYGGLAYYKHPNYCKDLNAAAELEAFTIEKASHGRYAMCLILETGHDTPLDKFDWSLVAIVSTATAEQRTIACLKALGKMPEGV